MTSYTLTKISKKLYFPPNSIQLRIEYYLGNMMQVHDIYIYVYIIL